jgi:hypothetical protein
MGHASDYLIGDIPWIIANGASVGVRNNDWPGRSSNRVKTRANSGMGKIDNYAELFHSTYYAPSESAQSDIGGFEALISDSIARIVRELHHAQPTSVKSVQKVDVILNRVSPLEVQDHRGLAERFRVPDIGDIASDAYAIKLYSLDCQPFGNRLHGGGATFECARCREEHVDAARADIRQPNAEAPWF